MAACACDLRPGALSWLRRNKALCRCIGILLPKGVSCGFDRLTSPRHVGKMDGRTGSTRTVLSNASVAAPWAGGYSFPHWGAASSAPHKTPSRQLHESVCSHSAVFVHASLHAG